jgi:hypothetical protein
MYLAGALELVAYAGIGATSKFDSGLRFSSSEIGTALRGGIPKCGAHGVS